MTYVLHSNWKNDLPFTLLKDFDEASGTIQLKLYNKLGATLDRIRKAFTLAIEPEVPLELVQGHCFETMLLYDYIVLCQSPEYTPLSADRLLKVFAKYIDLI